MPDIEGMQLYEGQQMHSHLYRKADKFKGTYFKQDKIQFLPVQLHIIYSSASIYMYIFKYLSSCHRVSRLAKVFCLLYFITKSLAKVYRLLLFYNQVPSLINIMYSDLWEESC